jgi:signal transduction histidine kinase
MAHNGNLATWAVDSRLPHGLMPMEDSVTSSRALRRQLKESEAARLELSRRMINAQEADRTRLARELHDDIGQSLAVLKIQMLRSGERTSDNPGGGPPDLKELAGRLDPIINKVSSLSHDLHSSALEYLGLAAAVKSHCLECSRQLEFPIRCHCEGVSDELDKTLTLTFFRILQEGIHNALKHSHATSMQVRMIGTNRDLNLEISDDGVGFNVEAVRFGTGLGLISIRERIHLAGGQCILHSSPRHGTRINVSAPLPPRSA